MMSVALPAPNGINARIGFAGQSCARAGPATTNETAATTAKTITDADLNTGTTSNLDFRIASSPLCTRFSKSLCSFYAVEAVRCIFDGEEDDIGIGARLAVMHRVGGDIERRAGFGFDRLTIDGGVKRAFEDVDPLLVGVRMRRGAGAGRHAHQADDHAVAFDAGAVRRRIIGAAQNVIHIGEVEKILAGASPLGARRAGGRPRSGQSA